MAKEKTNYNFNSEKELNRYTSINFLLKFQREYITEIWIDKYFATVPDKLREEIIKRGKALFDLRVEDYLL